VAEIVGPSADEFLLEVQQASTGPPWNMDSPDAVCPFTSATLFHNSWNFHTFILLVAFVTRSTRTVHTSAKARPYQCRSIRIRICGPDRYQNLIICSWLISNLP